MLPFFICARCATPQLLWAAGGPAPRVSEGQPFVFAPVLQAADGTAQDVLARQLGKLALELVRGFGTSYAESLGQGLGEATCAWLGDNLFGSGSY